MNFKFKFIAFAILVLVVSCAKNPFTGKSTMALVPNSQIFPSAFQQYNQFLSENKVIKGTADAKRIETIGFKIKTASERWLTAHNQADYLKDYAWEYKLVDSNEVNAWCMPGGKIVFYTGILPICKDDAGIAAVMGHEVAHALAGHGNERISQQVIAQYGSQILGGTVSNGQIGQVIQAVYPLGAQVALLKYGRTQELEADEMGLYFMAMAGYDPRQASPFWERMQALSKGSSTPEFLSTHPNPENRKADIAKHLPKALEYYKAAGGKL